MQSIEQMMKHAVHLELAHEVIQQFCLVLPVSSKTGVIYEDPARKYRKHT